ncbi:Atrial natriuretic peptide receptor 2 [Hypsibius exemplaris]|uniref:guanylate cyclase n=1 Tax=Hypsibius exemplaris TaxID=2072580 RepID=A0A9X6NMB4_HYPEX|nr:Atrial natriuretic peptide receptor 2 [Hypsibius exemplaris]
MLGGALGGTFLFILVSGFGGFAIYHHIQRHKDLNDLAWLAAWHEIFINQQTSSMSSTAISLASRYELNSSHTIKESVGQTSPIVATFRNTVVLMRPCPVEHVHLSSALRAEVRVAKSLAHESLLKFIRACIEPEHVTVLSKYCSKGTLQDVLQNEVVTLDWVFRFSFIHDIVSALLYLQASPLLLHGRLTSRCCFIDKRFLLKIGDFGLPSLYDSTSNTAAKPFDLLCTAPELLRSMHCGGRARATTEGDVILSEIILRESPYFFNNIPSGEIVKNVQLGDRPKLRPIVHDTFCQEEIMMMMRSCWAEDPVERSRGTTQRGTNLKSAQSCEVCRTSLEVSVNEKTQALVEEKKKMEQLLYSILPRAVAEQLKRGEAVLPESYDSVTIYFGDIVEFTALSAASSPIDIVTLMNDLYCRFDEIIATFDAYKVETFGDCYVIVSGLPHRNGQQHAGEIARLALALRETMWTFKLRHLPGKSLQIRIGLNSGLGTPSMWPHAWSQREKVCASLILGCFTFRTMKIQMTQTTETILRFLGSFRTELQGVVQVKGKGEMRTFWLNSEELS